MTDYCIEKPHQKISGRDWGEAYGLTAKSYPKANNDAEAIKIFIEVTKKCRTPYRLIKWGGFGFNVNKTVLAEINIKEK